MLCGVVRSNEKSWVCNIFVALYPKNPVKLRIQSYASDNFSYQRDNSTEYQKNIKTLGNPVFSRVFLCLNLEKENI